MKNILEIKKELNINLPTQIGDGIIFNKDNTKLSTHVYYDEISKVTKAAHFYNEFRIDGIWWHSDYEIFKNLSILLFSSLFNDNFDGLEVIFKNPNSDIKSFKIPTIGCKTNKEDYDLNLIPVSYHYIFDEYEKHPWCNNPNLIIQELPVFSLTTKNNFVTDSNLNDRDTIIIENYLSYGYKSTSKIAALLMDFSLDKNNSGEIQLESESGFRGVGVSSVEMTFHNPNSEIYHLD